MTLATNWYLSYTSTVIIHFENNIKEHKETEYRKSALINEILEKLSSVVKEAVSPPAHKTPPDPKGGIKE